MYAIAGGKGGCGKTTTVCGLARALVRAGRRPIVVDADIDMPDLHDRVGAAPEPGLDALGAGARLGTVLQVDHDLDGVAVVASGRASGVPNRRAGNRMSRRGVNSVNDPPSTTRQALDRLTTVDRPVLVDCPAGAGPDVAAALGTADCAIVVSTDTRESLEDAAKTAAMSSALETPVAGLCLRDSSADQVPDRTPTSQDPTGTDEQLRQLVDAPTVVHVPSHRERARDPPERPAPSVNRRTAAASRYDRLARVTVLRSGSSGANAPLRGNPPAE
jgi:septum site-determining protein MinD